MDIDKIINNDKQLLISNYFQLQSEAEEKYGQNTIVFIEIGSFYEVYESDKVGKASEIAKSLNILLTKKNKNIPELSTKNPFLCGIPTVSLDKHLQKLSSENKWTILLISQKGRPPNITRFLEKIISPGTNIDFVTSESSSFIASVYFEKNNKGIFSAGISLIDVTIGNVFTYEKYGVSNDKEIVLDEVRQLLSTKNISELIITHDIEDISFLETLSNHSILVKNSKDFKDNFNINYQNEIFKHTFKCNSHLSPIEEVNMERMPFSTISLSILLDFIIEHNKLICENLQIPIDILSSKYMYLGNNPLAQLDIYNRDSLDVLSVVNKGLSSIGRRFIKEQLMNPLISKKDIEDRYFKSTLYLDNPNRKDIEVKIKSIYDIERLLRKVEIGTIQPFELSNLFSSLQEISNIEIIEDCSDNNFVSFLESIYDVFDFDIMSLSNLTNISKTFIKEGISKEIDISQNKINSLLLCKDEIVNSISDSFSFKDSDSEGFYLEISKKKFNESLLADYSIKDIKNLKNSKKIFIEELSEISDDLILLKDSLIKNTLVVYKNILNDISTLYLSLIRNKITYICNLEFYINNAKLIEDKGYCIPSIVDSDDNFYEVESLRHPIVETIEKEIFIPNNVQFGSKKEMKLDTDVLFNNDKLNGFLLYGQNSSGKTVLSKSVGISIILAQAGFFVPAKTLKFSIFNSLFTRISGSDNILRGLSTFAVEMLELKNILNRADNRSLVIGDEISHGTETISGLSIVAATILNLKEKDCSFIIATHLHQLGDINEIQETEEISSVHLSLSYDEVKDELSYNRKIQKGSGSSIYGLEFAKSLKLPSAFLSKAYSIRKEIANDLSGLENLTKKKKSRYNSSLFVGVCSKCGDPAEDVHHIIEQKEANDKGMIDHFHKNHKSNLDTLCKKCHNLEHS